MTTPQIAVDELREAAAAGEPPPLPTDWQPVLADALASALAAMVEALGGQAMRRAAKAVCRERERDLFCLAPPLPASFAEEEHQQAQAAAASGSSGRSRGGKAPPPLTWPARDGGGPVRRKFDNYKYKRYGECVYS